MKGIKIPEKSKVYFYVVFRVLVGLGFLLHGGQKLFGWFGGAGGSGSVKIMSLMGAAGIIEAVGGLLIILGFFTSIVAFIAAVEMIIAYYLSHLPKGIVPLTNYGEPAYLYFAVFLVLIAYGAGKYSLEKFLLKKEIFH